MGWSGRGSEPAHTDADTDIGTLIQPPPLWHQPHSHTQTHITENKCRNSLMTYFSRLPKIKITEIEFEFGELFWKIYKHQCVYGTVKHIHTHSTSKKIEWINSTHTHTELQVNRKVALRSLSLFFAQPPWTTIKCVKMFPKIELNEKNQTKRSHPRTCSRIHSRIISNEEEISKNEEEKKAHPLWLYRFTIYKLSWISNFQIIWLRFPDESQWREQILLLNWNTSLKIYTFQVHCWMYWYSGKFLFRFRFSGFFQPFSHYYCYYYLYSAYTCILCAVRTHIHVCIYYIILTIIMYERAFYLCYVHHLGAVSFSRTHELVFPIVKFI